MKTHTRLALAITVVCVLAFVSESAAIPPIIVESKCASGGSYVEGGTGWGNSSAKSNRTTCPNGSRSTKNNGAWADFIPPIAIEGFYDVYVTWGSTTSSNNGPNAENVEISISDRDGTRAFLVNMRGHSTCSGSNANELIYIGRGYFQVGAGHKVRVSNKATGQCYNGASKRYVNADAVELQFVSPVPVLPASWGSIKALYRD